MKSNYKQLGVYIKQLDIRNTNNDVSYLRGVSSVYKCLIQSKANIIGTDMSTYKLVSKNQFVFNPNTARMGDKIPVALNNSDNCIVSQIYPVFEIIDHEVLNPEYLMMWFKRPEFDRYARFKSHGSAREIFDWEQMCDVELPVPSIDKQREIVKEYNVLVNKIELNDKVIKKLEETAQSIYKQWFVDFEFPDVNGKPYKSNGGEMEFNEELEKNIPRGWKLSGLGNIAEITSGKTPFDKNHIKTTLFKYPIYGAGGIMGYCSKFLFNEKILSMGRVGTHGIIKRINFQCWASDNTLLVKSNYYEYVYQILLNINYDEINRGGVQGLITQTDIKNSKIMNPGIELLKLFENKIGKIMLFFDLKLLELEDLETLKNLLLSKIATINN